MIWVMKIYQQLYSCSCWYDPSKYTTEKAKVYFEGAFLPQLSIDLHSFLPLYIPFIRLLISGWTYKVIYGVFGIVMVEKFHKLISVPVLGCFVLDWYCELYVFHFSFLIIYSWLWEGMNIYLKLCFGVKLASWYHFATIILKNTIK